MYSIKDGPKNLVIQNLDIISIQRKPYCPLHYKKAKEFDNIQISFAAY